MKERMDSGFAVFNSHVNRASQRADREFKAQYGQDAFDQYIAPLHKAGIMLILHDTEDSDALIHRVAWVTLCTAYVNEKIPYRLKRKATA